MMAKLNNLQDYNLEHLHSAVSAGEPLNREVVEQFKRNFNLTVRDGYGQTESTLLIGFLKIPNLVLVQWGKVFQVALSLLLMMMVMKCLLTKGNIAVPLDLPALFKGYYKDEERTKAASAGEYYVTGDLAHKDEDGYFWFEGRR